MLQQVKAHPAKSENGNAVQHSEELRFKGVMVRFEYVTPKRAKELLEPAHSTEEKMKNATIFENRFLRERNVGALSGQMKEGEWFGLTCETIKISPKGDVMDGQHRLWSVIDSNSTQLFLVCYNVPEEAMSKIDTGMKRTAGDVLHIAGVRSANQIAGIIRAYLFLRGGGSPDQKANYTGAKIFNTRVLNVYKEAPDFWQEVNRKTVMWYMQFSRILYPSTLGALYVHFHDKDPNDAEEFMEKLCGGNNLPRYSPILHLRNFLIDDRNARLRVRAEERTGLILKAWNAYRNHEKMTKLTFDPTKERVPKAI